MTIAFITIGSIGLGILFGWLIFNKPNSDEKGRLTAVTDERDRVLQQNEIYRTQISGLTEKIAIQETEKKGLEQRFSEYKLEIKDIQTTFTETFKNIGNDIFRDHTKNFKDDSKRSLNEILDPLKENIEKFNTKIDNVITSKDEIIEVTKNLTLAFKGDSQFQGEWGEFILTSILDASGLREGEEYIVQGKDLQLTNTDGGKIKPDVIINLPGGKHIIIDSKVSLKSYEAYLSTSDHSSKEGYFNKIIDSMYCHVDDLNSKKYYLSEKLLTPEIVLMFVPLEGTFSLAMQREKALWTYGWEKQIVIVGPTTLFATLRTIESMWKRERQNKYAMQIAKEAGLLYDKFADFAEDIESITTNLDRTGKSVDEAKKKLSGRGGISSKIQNLKELGAKASKKIPNQYLIDEIVSSDESQAEELKIKENIRLLKDS